jgi:hypothetical protein
MTTLRGTFSYRVTRTQIVEPDNVSVIAPSADRSRHPRMSGKLRIRPRHSSEPIPETAV